MTASITVMVRGSLPAGINHLWMAISSTAIFRGNPAYTASYGFGDTRVAVVALLTFTELSG
jgi:hypothetical protein